MNAAKAFPRMRRMLLRRMPPLLLIFAIAAYGAALASAHDAATHANEETRYVRLLGASADMHRVAALRDPQEEALLLEPRGRNFAYAAWRLPTLTPALSPGSIVRREDAFVTGLTVGFSERAGSAIVSLDGHRIGVLSPLVKAADDEGPYAVANPPFGAIDIPPGYTIGFRFAVPSVGACATSDCTVDIRARGTTWIVRTVGILFRVQPSPLPALWNRPFAPWLIACIASAGALLSHMLLSVRPRRASGTAAAPPATTP